MMAKLKRTYQSHFLIRSSSPSAHARATAEPAFSCPGYPSRLFHDFSSLPATYFPEFFKFLFMVRLLHKLGDADRRLTRQDRLFGHRWGRSKMETASN